ncbi:DUF2742 domain-containing protein [Streptomyces fulvorobeus]|uniref:DUF2742 domain-containing protein n=1 Tax=Streptomyces fulvorobeus TaxID=284028 RepID=A0A7J0C2Q0_9ACTN|nr:DUF2742 domain-containing protein [Streptomyces fulvorobeus]NYE40398.1 hypothetical protein [Streptomyces fulvorobeus]GFM96678.1 hypothetical protein Sfulv_14890 [Streptomyces fulvorobeus]
MTGTHNAPGGEPGAVRDQLGGGSTPTVPNSGRRLRAIPENATAGDVTALRAEMQVAALGVDSWPTYGSPTWLRLAPKDPRAYAAILEAAERHRRADAETQRLDRLMDEDPVTWWREITADANAYAARQGHAIAARRTAEEIRTARDRATHREPHQLRATPGWPPIAIPGHPGRYLTHGQEISA